MRRFAISAIRPPLAPAFVLLLVLLVLARRGGNKCAVGLGALESALASCVDGGASRDRGGSSCCTVTVTLGRCGIWSPRGVSSSRGDSDSFKIDENDMRFVARTGAGATAGGKAARELDVAGEMLVWFAGLGSRVGSRFGASTLSEPAYCGGCQVGGRPWSDSGRAAGSLCKDSCGLVFALLPPDGLLSIAKFSMARDVVSRWYIIPDVVVIACGSAAFGFNSPLNGRAFDGMPICAPTACGWWWLGIWLDVMA